MLSYSRLPASALITVVAPCDQAPLEVLSDKESYQSITLQQAILRPSLGEARVWVPSQLPKESDGRATEVAREDGKE